MKWDNFELSKELNLFNTEFPLSSLSSRIHSPDCRVKGNTAVANLQSQEFPQNSSLDTLTIH